MAFGVPRLVVNDPRTFTIPTTAVLGAAGVKLADSNPQRVSLLVLASAGSILIGFSSTAGLSGRTVTLPAGKGLSLDSALGAHQGELWGWTPGGAVSVSVLEQVLDPTAANPEEIGEEAAGLPVSGDVVPSPDRLPWERARRLVSGVDVRRRL